MFNSRVLETAIGLVSCYAAVSLLTSSVYEGIASTLRLRAKSLLSGVRALLNEKGKADAPGLTLALYNNALIHPCGNGQADTIKGLGPLPSYVDAARFAEALVEGLGVAADDFAKLGEAIDKIADPQLKQLLRGFYDRSGQSVAAFKQSVSSWFDAGMERVAGHYKRQSQLYCFVIALVIAGMFNIDTFHLMDTLWRTGDAAGTFTIQTQSVEAAQQLLNTARDQTLPMGWREMPGAQGTQVLLIQFLGWFVTATAATMGAPFWFDLLQRFVQIRGAGGKPAEKSKEAK